VRIGLRTLEPIPMSTYARRPRRVGQVEGAEGRGVDAVWMRESDHERDQRYGARIGNVDSLGGIGVGWGVVK
jgi:hypothetical protein